MFFPIIQTVIKLANNEEMTESTLDAFKLKIRWNEENVLYISKTVETNNGNYTLKLM